MIFVNAYCEDSILKTEVRAEQSYPPHIFHAKKKQSFFSCILFHVVWKHIGGQSFNFL